MKFQPHKRSGVSRGPLLFNGAGVIIFFAFQLLPLLFSGTAAAANPTIVPGTVLQRIYDGLCQGNETTVSVGGNIAAQSICLEANVAADSGITVRLEVEFQTVGTAFTNTATVCSPSCTVADGGQGVHVVTVGGLNYNSSYHWQVRGVDSAGGISAWTPFGGNGETVPDFTPQNQPPTVSALEQRIYDTLCQGNETTVAVGGTIDTPVVCLEGNVSDAFGQKVRLEVEVKPVGTDFNGSGLVCSPDSGCGGTTNQGVKIILAVNVVYNTSYHWRVRGVDDQGLQGAWTSFGGNLETAADFIPINQPPTVSASALQQRIYDGLCQGNETTVATGATINTQSICLQGNVSDAPGSLLRLEIEVKPLGAAFNNTATNCEPSCTATDLQTTKIVTVSGLTSGTSYHWQARGVDSLGAASNWTSFGGNAETAADFIVGNPSPTLTAMQQREELSTGTCQGNENTIVVGGNVASGDKVCLEANVSDAAGVNVHLEVEVKPVGTDFNGTGVVCAPFSNCSNGVQGLMVVEISGLSNGVGYHWRARAVDATLPSVWISFGNNNESVADFSVNNIPPTISALAQRPLSGVCQSSTPAVPVGGDLNALTICLEADVGDTDNQVRLEVEVKPVSTSFDGLGLLCNPSCTSVGSPGLKAVTAGVTYGTSYHWRARAVDIVGVATDWTAFGGNTDIAFSPPPSDPDFNVVNIAPTISALQQRMLSSGGLCQGGATTVPVGGDLNALTICLEADIEDVDAAQSVQLEVEVRPIGTAFTNTLTASGTSGGVGIKVVKVATLSYGTSYHWQARGVDAAGATSSWKVFPSVSPFNFDNNPPTTPADPDFKAVNLPPTLSAILQRIYDGNCQANETTVLEGNSIGTTTVCLEADLEDVDAAQSVKLEVEVRPVGTAFDGTATTGGVLGNHGVKLLTITGLTYGTSYHWRARGLDSLSLASGWTEFGTAGNTDFAVVNATPTATIVEQRVNDGTCDGLGALEVTVVEGGAIEQTSICLNATLSDANNDIIAGNQTITFQVEVVTVGSSFTGLPTVPGVTVGEGTVARVTVGSLFSGTAYHWKYRAVDSTNRTNDGFSAWTEFGTSGNTDFTVTNHPPSVISALQRTDSSGLNNLNGLCDGTETTVGEGGGVPQTFICLEANVTDPDSNPIRLEIEVQQAGAGFTATATHSEPPSGFALGGIKKIKVSGLVSGTGYHWRYRGLDDRGAVTAWTEFGTVGNTDFVMNNFPPTINPATVLQRVDVGSDGSCVVTEPTVAEGGEINENKICLEAGVSDIDGGLVTLEVEVQPVGTSFSSTATTIFGPAALGTIRLSVSPLTYGTDYHWRYRAVDGNSVASAWTEFGTAGNTDFRVTNTPPALSAVEQRVYDGAACDGTGEPTVVENGSIQQLSICMNATLSDVHAGETNITLQVEVRAAGTGFNGTATVTSAPVSTGSVARVTATGLSYGTSYHWRYRGVDDQGFASAWTEFGTSGNTDFTVTNATPAVSVAPQQRVYDGLCNGSVGETTILEGDSIQQQSICVDATLSDTNTLPAQTIKLEVEVRLAGTAFSNTATSVSPGVLSGSTVRMLVPGAVELNPPLDLGGVPAANLKGLWHFNEGGGTTSADFSGNNNAATLGTSPATPGWTTADDARFGASALSLDGNDDIVTVGTPRPSNTFTFEAWVYVVTTHEVDTESTTGTTGVPNGAPDQEYVFWPEFRGGVGTSSDSGAGLSVGTNGISVYEHSDSYLPPLAVYNGAVPAGWNHIAVVYNNKQPSIYLNGTLVRTGLTSPKTNVYAPAQFGGGVYGFYQGRIDEVSIYNIALTSQQILNHAGLGGLAFGSYHWQYRAVDSAGGAAGWTEYLTVGNTDFTVTNATPSAATVEQRVFDGLCDGLTSTSEPTVVENGNILQQSICMNATLSDTNAQPSQTITLQVEVQPTGTAFTNTATTTSAAVNSGAVARVAVSGNLGLGNLGGVADTNLKGLWHFDETNGVGPALDSSGNNNSGTYGTSPATPTQTTAGKFSSALSFDGDDYVNVTDPGISSLDLTNAITLEAWVSPNTSTAANDLIVGKENSYLMAIRSGTLQYAVQTAGTWAWINTGLSVPVSPTWSHIAIVYNGTTITGYVNSVPDPTPDTDPDGGSVTQNNNPICIGSRGTSCTSAGTFFNGLIDEVAIYNAALTQTQITNHAQRIDLALGASYHWQYRAVDSTGRTDGQTGWTEFGTAGNTDFNVVNATPTVSVAPQQRIFDGLCDGSAAETTITESTGQVQQQSICLNATLSDLNTLPSQTITLQVEMQPTGAVFSNTATATSVSALSGGTVRMQVTGLSYGTSYHWQFRAVDSTGRTDGQSGWTEFGTAGNTDFNVVNEAPTAGALQQRVYDGLCDGLTSTSEPTVATGGNIDKTTICFEALMSDTNTLPSQTITLEVEVQPVGTDFSNTASATSAVVGSGTVARITFNALTFNTSYHWQARGVDSLGAAGAWTSFGTNTDPNDTDFIPTQFPPTINPATVLQRVYDGTCNGDETTVAVNGDILQQTICLEANVADNDSATVRVEVEVQPVGTAFNNTATVVINPVNIGTAAVATVIEAGSVNPLAIGNLASGVSNANLRALWHFDEGVGSTVFDTGSSPAENGTLIGFNSGGPIWTNAGRFGAGLIFTGAPFIFSGSTFYALTYVEDGETLDGMTTLTVEAWINPSVVGGTYRTIVVKELNYLLTVSPGGKLSGWIGNGTTWSGETLGNTILVPGNWYHVAMTYGDGAATAVKLYLNGALDSGTGSFAGGVANNTNPVRIGDRPPFGTNQSFNGTIDEVAIYDTPLTLAQIADHAQRGGEALAYGTSYHWQIRAVDPTGLETGWTSFGGNLDPGDTDFRVKNETPTATAAEQRFDDAGAVCNGSAGEATIIEGGNISVGNICFNATLSDANTLPSQTITLQVEVQPAGSAFSGTATAASSSVSAGTIARVRVSGLTDGSYHWQYRAVDSTGRTDGQSAWTEFGTSGNTDFAVGNVAPTVFAGPQQREDDDGTCNGNEATIIEGGSILQQSFCIDATLQDDNPNDTIQLQVEVRAAGTGFSTSTASSSFVSSGGAVLVRVATGLSYGTSYHWRYRAFDSAGGDGGWTEFGTLGNTDFTVTNATPSVSVAPQQRVYDGLCDGLTITSEPTVVENGNILQKSLCIDATLSDANTLPNQTIALQVEVQPAGTSFSNTATATSGSVLSGSTVRMQVTGLSYGTSYHWQFRAVDSTGRTDGKNGWTEFGTAGNTDFNVVNAAPTPATVQQRVYDGLCDGVGALEVTVLETGSILQQSICMNATLSDTNTLPTQTITLEVEVRAAGTGFSSTATATSAAVGSGTIARATAAGFSYGTSYHWQYRAVDQDGGATGWTEFGTAGNTDFNMVNATPTASALRQRFYDGSCDGTEAGIAVGGVLTTSGICLEAAVGDTNALPSNNIRLEIEVQPVGTGFTGTATHYNPSSTTYGAQGVKTIAVTGLTFGGSYHWRARVLDETGRSDGISAWTSFGGNADPADADFTAPCRADGIIGGNGDNIYGATGSGAGGSQTLTVTPGVTSSYALSVQNEQTIATTFNISWNTPTIPPGWSVVVNDGTTDQVSGFNTVSLAPGASAMYTLKATPPTGAATEQIIVNIAANSSVCSTTPPPGSVGLWHFDEGSGETAGDSSGQSNTGTVFGGTTIDSADATTGWSFSANLSVSPNTTTFKQGTGSINLLKASSTSTDNFFFKTITPAFSLSGKTLSVWLFIRDAAALAKLSQVEIFAFDGAQSCPLCMIKDISPATLTVGVWNQLVLDPSTATFTSTGFDQSSVDIIRIDLDTVPGTTAFATGEFMMDFWHLNNAWTTSGKFGNALSFDGVGNYVNVPASTGSLDIDVSPVTIEAWIYPTSFPAAGVYREIAGRGVQGVNGYGLALNGNQINVGHHGGSNFSSTTTLTANQWYHVAGVIDGANSRIYINGVQDPATGTVDVVASGDNATIGGVITTSPATYGNYFAGTIDEVVVWNRALIDNDIFAHATATGPALLVSPPAVDSVKATAQIQTGPTNPNTLQVVFIGDTQLNLRWADLAGNETGYKVERAGPVDPPGDPCAGSFIQIKEVLRDASQSAANGSTVFVYYADTGLSPGKSYCYQVRAFIRPMGASADGSQDIHSAYSNQAPATTSSSTDTTAPAAVTDLTIKQGEQRKDSITLVWTAPGDDGTTGLATSYDMRYSMLPIVNSGATAGVNVDYGTTCTNTTGPTLNATRPVDCVVPVINLAQPQPAGTPESRTVTGRINTSNQCDAASADTTLPPCLISNTIYYFALKTADERGFSTGSSGLSNVAYCSGTTTPCGDSTMDGSIAGRTALRTNFNLVSVPRKPSSQNPMVIFEDDISGTPQIYRWNSTGFNANNGSFISYDSSYTAYGLSSDAVGVWHMDSGSPTPDSSGYANHGTLVGSPSYVAGKFSSALSFNGTNYVEMGNVLDFTTGSFTVEAWINQSVSGASNRIVSKRDTTTSAGYHLAVITGNIVRASIGNGTTTIDKDSTAVIANSQWVHVVMVVDRAAQTLQLYVDGVAQGSTVSISPTTLTVTNARPLRLGASSQATPADFFNGLIDEVAIWNRALTVGEIWAHATAAGPLTLVPEINGDGIGNENSICEPGEACLQIQPGEGYFIVGGSYNPVIDVPAGSTAVTLTNYCANSVPLGPSGVNAYAVRLKVGWNMIGDPFTSRKDLNASYVRKNLDDTSCVTYAVAFDNAHKWIQNAGSIYELLGSNYIYLAPATDVYNLSTSQAVMEPWKGYFIQAGTDSADTNTYYLIIP